MNNRNRAETIGLSAVALAVFGICSSLGATDYREEVGRQLAQAMESTPLTFEALSGEQVSLYDGRLSFRHVDISLPGNSGLPVELARRWSQGGGRRPQRQAFEDWDLDVPYVSSVVSRTHGWRVLADDQLSRRIRMDGTPQLIDNDTYFGEQSGYLTGNRCSAPSRFATPLEASREALGLPTFEVIYALVPLTPGAPPTPLPQVINPSRYWDGYKVNIPGGGEEHLLLRSTENVNVPSESHLWVTQSGLVGRCISEPQGGEGFEMTTPDGITYRFDYLVHLDFEDTNVPAADPDPRLIVLPPTFPDMSGASTPWPHIPMSVVAKMRRSEARLYATRVEDRFGNWVAYDYQGNNLSRIRSSDGREITIQRNARGTISHARAHGREWRYSYQELRSRRPDYNDRALSSVENPDASTWRFDLGELFHADIHLRPNDPVGSNNPPCSPYGPELPIAQPNIVYAGAITSPSGATSTYRARPVRHNITDADGFLVDQYYCTVVGQYRFFDSISLVSKSVTGPGLSEKVWTYSYAQPAARFSSQCSGSNPCPSEKTVTISGPNSIENRYKFSVRNGHSLGHLLAHEVLEDGVLLESRRYTRDTAGGSRPFVRRIGYPLVATRMESEAYGQWNMLPVSNIVDPSALASGLQMPTLAETVERSGALFETRYLQFDDRARPTRVRKTSPGTLGTSRTDRYEYHDESARWILGQVARQSNIETGAEIYRATFDANAVKPSREYAFGALTAIINYRADGTISSVTDAGNRVTLLSSWKRGIPGRIVYNDQTSVDFEINDHGEVESATDEVGLTHRYEYDPMGRVTRVEYPAVSGETWHPTNMELRRLTDQPYGLGAGHWLHTTTRGTYQRQRYLDAMMRQVLDVEVDTANVAASRRMRASRFERQGQDLFESYPRSSASSMQAFSSGTRSRRDALGRTRLVSEDVEGGHTAVTRIDYLSNALGPYRRVRDAQGNETRSWFHGRDAGDHSAPIRIEKPESVLTTIERDLFGKPLSITRSGSYAGSSQSLSRQYVYDGNQRLCKQIEPETGATIFAHYADGSIHWSAGGIDSSGTSTCGWSDAPMGARVHRSYDNRGRLSSLVFPDGLGSQSWRYTDDGLPEEILTNNSDGRVTVNQYAYNSRRLPTHEVLGEQGGPMRSVAYRYDAHGHLRAHVYPSGLQVDYQPNALGQATRAGSFATGALYHPNGALRQFTYGNGIVSSVEQNLRGLPHRRRDFGGQAQVLDDNYEYDLKGNVLAILDGLPGARREQLMEYDGLDRLIAAQSPMFGDALYAYDALDNLRRVRVAGRDRTHHFGAADGRLNRVSDTQTGATVALLDYDSQGNLSSRAGDSFEFDFGNRLRTTSHGEAYGYDGHGRRNWAANGAGAVIDSFYGVDGVLRYQRDEGADRVFEYIYLAGRMIARTSGPLPPPAIVLTGPSNTVSGSFTLTWSTQPTAQSYRIEVENGSNGWQTVYEGSSTSVSLTGRPAGMNLFRGRACRADSCSEPSFHQVEVSPAPVLSAPSWNTTGTYSVQWTEIGGATSYQLRERRDGASWTSAYTGTARSFPATGRIEGDWDYQVRACSAGICGVYSGVQRVSVRRAVTISAPGTNSTGSYTVDWTPARDAVNYQLRERVNGGAWSATTDSSSTSRSFSGRNSGTYGHQVRPCFANNGCGPWSSEATVAVNRIPATVPVVSAPTWGINGSYTVTWGSVAHATKYQIRSRVGSGAWGSPSTLTATTRTYTGMSAGARGYQVRACNALDQCTGWSTERVVTSVYPPVAPGGLTAPSSSNTGAYSVSWGGVSGAVEYELEERLGTGAWVRVHTGAQTTSNRSGRSNGTWSYRVRGCNAAGCGAYSAVISVSVLLPPGSAPTLTVSHVILGQYRLQWTQVPTASTYQAQHRMPGASWSALQTSGNIHDIYLVQPGAHEFRVRACNAGGCGAYSPSQFVHIEPECPGFNCEIPGPLDSEEGAHRP